MPRRAGGHGGAGGPATRPPLRLRLAASDVLCARSMEVEWEDGTGLRRRWSSWADEAESSWYEATKLLPANAYDITVRFLVHGVGGPYPVCRVNRRKRSRPWIEEQDGAYPEEVIAFRQDCGSLDVGVDAVFELCGPMHGCYVDRAWNAARVGDREPWESWPDRASKPRAEPPLAVLGAADRAADPWAGLGDPHAHYVAATRRLCAAARDLLVVHRRALQGLRGTDERFTGQWLGVNVGNTASAGLGIASAVLLFMAPPVGVGLGIGSAVTSGLTFAGDSLADRANCADLRQQLSIDDWNAFAVAELMEEWVRALEALGAGPPSKAAALLGDRSPPASSGREQQDAAAALTVSSAVDGGLTAGAVMDGAAATAKQVVTHVVDVGRAAAVAGQAVGITGALISTGFAVRGWSTTKAGQAAVRAKIADLTRRIRNIQLLLVEFDVLECLLCTKEIAVVDEVRHCEHSLHCFHERCLRDWQARKGAHCPICESPLETRADVMAIAAGEALHAPPREDQI